MKHKMLENHRRLDIAITNGLVMLSIMLISTIGMEVKGEVIVGITLIDILIVHLILFIFDMKIKYQEMEYRSNIEDLSVLLFREGMRCESNIGNSHVFVTGGSKMRKGI